MKKMILYPLVASMMIMLAASGNLKSQELSFTISLDKASYNKGEPVKCLFELKNTGKRDLVVNNRFLVNMPDGPHDISLVITGPGMLPALFISQINAGSPTNEFVLLKPGKSVTKTYKLSEDFLLSEVGKYSIVAYYENKSNPLASLKLPDSWKGTLISNKANFSLR
jgi:hypothetical protein